MKNIYKWRFLFLITLFTLFNSSCKKFLDVVPDNVATLDMAFDLRNEAEKYLFTCYSFIPKNGDVVYNAALLGGDELWIPYERAFTSYAFEIARGNQRKDGSYMNSWIGNWQGGGPGDRYGLFKGIRVCNTFLENLEDPNQVPDLTSLERQRWTGEALFLKAYYHFLLIRRYGPIPIIDKNLPVDASENEVKVVRQPVDSCFKYVVNLLDSATKLLPPSISDRITEEGRATKAISSGIKTKALLLSASPLFNGNTDFQDLKNSEGQQLFNTTYDANKWQVAADAAKETIDFARAAGNNLYYFTNSPFQLSDTTITKLSIRQAVCERWNPEIIWGNPNSMTNDLQLQSMAPLNTGDDPNNAHMVLSAPLKIAQQFYTKNGVPINEDKNLDFTIIDELRVANHDERFNIQEGFSTARLNYDREPRFYADLGFDGSTWYKFDSPSNSDENTYHIEGKYAQYAGAQHAFFFNVTGYYVKKLVDWNQTMSSSGASYKGYPWPELRLADVFLMYAEALNEVNGPSNEVFQYLDSIRLRAGLKGVVESWTNNSINPSKPQTKEGLREIIHQERNIEMAFEGERFWDLKRWKEAARTLNQAITGWNIFGEEAASYYQITTVYSQNFIAPRDYFWPIPQDETIKNLKLVQNIGW